LRVGRREGGAGHRGAPDVTMTGIDQNKILD